MHQPGEQAAAAAAELGRPTPPMAWPRLEPSTFGTEHRQAAAAEPVVGLGTRALRLLVSLARPDDGSAVRAALERVRRPAAETRGAGSAHREELGLGQIRN